MKLLQLKNLYSKLPKLFKINKFSLKIVKVLFKTDEFITKLAKFYVRLTKFYLKQIFTHNWKYFSQNR